MRVALRWGAEPRLGCRGIFPATQPRVRRRIDGPGPCPVHEAGSPGRCRARSMASGEWTEDHHCGHDVPAGCRPFTAQVLGRLSRQSLLWPSLTISNRAAFPGQCHSPIPARTAFGDGDLTNGDTFQTGRCTEPPCARRLRMARQGPRSVPTTACSMTAIGSAVSSKPCRAEIRWSGHA